MAAMQPQRRSMKLSPREIDHLELAQCGQLAQRRLARGLKLNYPEAVALISSQMQERIRDGVSVAELMTQGKRLLGRRQVLTGVAEMIHEVQIEATFADGTTLLTVHSPIVSEDGDLAEALRGSFLPVPDLAMFEDAAPAELFEARPPGKLEDLERLAKKESTIQASFDELRGSADGARDAPEGMKEDAAVSRPRISQLLAFSLFVAVPFFGFGLADNFIMIIAGDAIDAHFGKTLGITTMCAAGLGNWLSDAIGLGLGDVIERAAVKLGFSDGGMTMAQQRLNITRLVQLVSKFVGISLGCFAGMLPLLFLTPHKYEFTDEDLLIYDKVFLPFSVKPSEFAKLLQEGKKRSADEGAVIVPTGTELEKVILLLRGWAAAHDWRESKVAELPSYVYRGKLEQSASKPDLAVNEGKLKQSRVNPDGAIEWGRTQSSSRVPIHGCVIGGSVFTDVINGTHVKGTPYNKEVVAAGPTLWIEWDFEKLKNVMEEDKHVHAAFNAFLYGELRSDFKRSKQETRRENYMAMLSAIVADGVVDEKERIFLAQSSRKFNIGEEEHASMLEELGWTLEDWERGAVQKQRQARSRVLSRVFPSCSNSVPVDSAGS